MTGPGGVPLTPEQEAVAADRSGSLLVAAGAGSGKTSVMVERFVRATREDGVEVDAILAITFTDKAASELRERIRRRFEELGDEERARATEGAYVSTIHAFCARVLRAHPLRAGLDPRFVVLDEPAADRLRGRAWEGALEAVLDRGGDAALDALAPWGPGDLRDMVVFAHEQLRSRGEAAPDLPDPEPRDLYRCADALRRAATELRPLLGTARWDESALDALDAVDRWSEEMDDEVPALPGRHTDALRGEVAERYRRAWEAVRGALLDHDLGPAYEFLRELLRKFRDRYAGLKDERSGLDFADLERKALALLESDADARERYAGRFAHVMVDEFQDTNPVQVRLLELLARDNLFTVGDELQSIYRFRHADVELFARRRLELEAEGRARSLTTNFRGSAGLLKGLNLTWAEGLFAAQAAEPLLPPDLDAPADERAIELLVTTKEGWDEVPLGNGRGGVPAWRMAEARLLAERVRRLVHEEGREPADVVVLLRATRDMSVYERALEEAGVPTFLIGGRGFWGQRQVQDLVSYLSLLANPRDDLRLYEALASPLCGVSSDTLVLVADARDGGPAWEAIDGCDGAIPDVEPADRERLAAFAERFREHRAAAPRLAVEALIERVARDGGYDLALLRMPGARRRMANVRKLMRLAREFQAAEGGDLRGFCDHVADLAGEVAAESREGEAPVEGEALDAVRLMTIHRAKGLEFPVVCVADLGREPYTGGRQYLRLGRAGQVGLKLPGGNGNGPRAGFAWEEIGEHERRADEAEERRLQYVAMTRAKELLVLSGAINQDRWAEKGGREAMAWLGPAVMRGVDEGLVECLLSAADNEVLPEEARAPQASPPQAEAPEAIEAPPPVPAPLLPRLPVDHLSYSSLQDYARCGYRFYLQRVLGLRPIAAPPGEEPGLPATVRGTIAHALLERIDFAAPVPPSREQVQAVAAAEGTVLATEDADEIAALVARFGSSELCARLAAAADVRREEQFSFLLHPSGSEPLLVTGVVDVIGAEGERRLVVDYKSDDVPAEEAAEHVEREYAGQRLVYALAALRDGAPEVEVAHCLLEHPDQPVGVRFRPEDVSRLEDELASLAAGVLAGEFAVTQTPHRWLCQTCPGRPALCSWDEERTMSEPPPAAR